MHFPNAVFQCHSILVNRLEAARYFSGLLMWRNIIMGVMWMLAFMHKKKHGVNSLLLQFDLYRN